MRPVFFLHIPKTAGTSIHRFLAEIMGGFHFLQYGSEAATPLSTVLARVPSAGGHVRLADVIEDWDPFVAGFTVLRDPVERFLSHYWFMREANQSDFDPMVRLALSHRLEELVDSDDPLVAYLANQHCWYLSTLPSSASLSDHCEAAVAHLRRFSVVGFTDNLSASLAQLADICGFSGRSNLLHLNVTKPRSERPKLSKKLQARLHEVTRFDQRLYAAARNPALLPAPPVSARYLPFAALARRSPSVFGTRRAVIDAVYIHCAEPLHVGDRFQIEVKWHAQSNVGLVVVGFALRDFARRLVHGTNSELLGANFASDQLVTVQHTLFNLQANFSAGLYHVDVALHTAGSSLRETFHWWEQAASFEVTPAPLRYHEGYTDVDAHLESVCGSAPQPPGRDGDFRLWISSALRTTEVASTFQLPVELFNGSRFVLSTYGDHPFHLSYHWRNEETGQIALFEGARTPLVPTQYTRTIRAWALKVVTPPVPGRYRLLPRLVQETVRWIDPPELSVDEEPIFDIVPK